MTTNAFAGLGSKLYLQQKTPRVAPTARNITAITKANPGVITSNAHGLMDGQVVTIAAVGGMTEINGTYYVAGATTNTFTLVSLDGVPVNSTSFTTYTSGGTATPLAYLPVSEARTINAADAQTPEIDVTTLLSTSREYLLGLQDAGEFSFEMNYVPFDPAIVELRQAKADALKRAFYIEFPEGSVYAFQGFVKAVPFQTDYQSAMSGSCTLKVTGATVWMP